MTSIDKSPKPKTLEEQEEVARAIAAAYLTEKKGEQAGSVGGASPMPPTPDAAVPAAAVPDTPTTPDASMGTVFSPEALERQREVFAELQNRADMWRTRIVGVKSQHDFDKLTNEAGRENGSYTVQSGPGFVFGNSLFRLLKDRGINMATEITPIKERAHALQAELRLLFLAKQTEIYPPKDTPVKTTAPAPAVAPATTTTAQGPATPAISDATVASSTVKKTPEATPSRPAEFSLPRKMGNKRLKFQAGGKTIEIWKKSGGYHIQENGGSVRSVSRDYLLKRGRSEGWVAISDRGENSSESSISPDVLPVADDLAKAGESPETMPTNEFQVGNAWEKVVSVGGVEIRTRLMIQSIDPNGVVTLTERRENQGGQPFEQTYSTDLASLSSKIRADGYASTEPFEALSGLPKAPEHAPEMSEPAPEGEQPIGDFDLSAHEAMIAKLREEVIAERTTFIAFEESKRNAELSVLKVLKRFLPSGFHELDQDEEVQQYRSRYDEKVLALQNAELEKLKRSGLSVKELRPEMAALIRRFEFEEADEIYDTRQAMRLEKQNQPLLEKIRAAWNEAPDPAASVGESNRALGRALWGTAEAVGGSMVRGIEKFGAQYNALRSKHRKLFLAASVAVAGGAGLAVTAGSFLAVPAAGLLLAKRWAGAAAATVAIEDVASRVAAGRRAARRNNVEGNLEALFDAMESEEDLEIKRGNKEEIDFSKFEQYLKEVSAKARQGEAARRQWDLYRKTGALLGGAALGSGAVARLAHLAHDYIGSAAPAHAASPEATTPHSTAPASGVPAIGEAAPDESAAPPPSVEAEPGAAKVVPSPMSPDSEAIARDLEKALIPMLESARAGTLPSVQELLGPHVVERGESIWKIATGAAKDVPGMDERATGRFAKLVELKLQDKLNADPALARAAGFTLDNDGKFSPHHIQAGAKLELGKLFSSEEMAKLMTEAQGTEPIKAAQAVASGVPDLSAESRIGAKVPIPSPTEKAAIQDAFMKDSPATPTLPSAAEKAAIRELFAFTPEQELTDPKGNVMKYIETIPREDQERLFHNFRKLSVELFQTNEVMGGEVYEMRYDPTVHPELMKAKLADVLANHQALAKNPLTSYDRVKNPLHWSQMEAVAKLAKAAAKTFGAEIARARTGESIQEYALRIAALTGQSGQKIPGFRMLN